MVQVPNKDYEISLFLREQVRVDRQRALSANGPRWAPGDGNVSQGGLYALTDKDDGWAIAWFEIGSANEKEDGTRRLPRWSVMKYHTHENAVHAATHSPARVLAQCEAFERIIDQYDVQPQDLSEQDLHRQFRHPDYEYLTVECGRKQDGGAPPDDTWEPNDIIDRGSDAEGKPYPRDNSRRFDFAEEHYYRRLRPDGPAPLGKPSLALRALATIYADREGFREEWRA